MTKTYSKRERKPAYRNNHGKSRKGIHKMVDKQLVTCCRRRQSGKFQELVPPPKQLLNWHKLSESTILELCNLVRSLQHPGECWMKRGFGKFWCFCSSYHPPFFSLEPSSYGTDGLSSWWVCWCQSGQ